MTTRSLSILVVLLALIVRDTDGQTLGTPLGTTWHYQQSDDARVTFVDSVAESTNGRLLIRRTYHTPAPGPESRAFCDGVSMHFVDVQYYGAIKTYTKAGFSLRDSTPWADTVGQYQYSYRLQSAKPLPYVTPSASEKYDLFRFSVTVSEIASGRIVATGELGLSPAVGALSLTSARGTGPCDFLYLGTASPARASWLPREQISAPFHGYVGVGIGGALARGTASNPANAMFGPGMRFGYTANSYLSFQTRASVLLAATDNITTFIYRPGGTTTVITAQDTARGFDKAVMQADEQVVVRTPPNHLGSVGVGAGVALLVHNDQDRYVSAAAPIGTFIYQTPYFAGPFSGELSYSVTRRMPVLKGTNNEFIERHASELTAGLSVYW